MKRLLVLAILAITSTANAGKSIMVLKAEGTADAATRTSVDASVLKLAKNIDGKVEMGDITLTDAAAMVGCDPAQAACKDDVLSTLGVDEVVATTATASPTGTNVTVRRLAKGSAPKAAQSIQPGKPSDSKMTQDLGALFGVAVIAPPTTTSAKATPATTAPTTTPPTTTTTTTTTHVTTTPTTATPPPTNPDYDAPFPPNQTAHPATAQATPVEPISAAPNGQVGGKDEDHRSYTWQKIGMGVGGGLVVLSFVLWAKAANTQQQIDEAPANTPADFMKLKQLESDADGQAGGGNLFFVTGIILGGVSAYSYWHGHRAHHSQTARIVPTLNPHGAGIAVTFGGGL